MSEYHKNGTTVTKKKDIAVEKMLKLQQKTRVYWEKATDPETVEGKEFRLWMALIEDCIGKR